MQSLISVLCEVDGLTFECLRQKLETERGKALPARTLYYWLDKLGIERDPEGFFHQEDAEILTALVRWLSLPHTTIATFIARLQKWRSTNAPQ